MRRLPVLIAVLIASFAAIVLPADVLAASKPAPPQTAVFAGGCFWCMENDMRGIPGVLKVESGYTGGHVDKPSYRDVTSETSGHYESVRVTYDPAKIDYGFLLYKYWKLVDPTDDGGQFCDRGPSYRPAVFVTPAQRPIAEKSRAEAAKRLKTGVMKAQILDLKTFWPAEAYHRDYAKNHAIEYHAYRMGCGRDLRLKQVWGG
ncbi:peptide methionine sulfoxide reductase [Caulobacter sp. Root1455]|uniref:peptide-methionine (S)-S-oxide reductase MsrA n=1 Tax=unclassified Caulobacter TaxID=2648921 RepID=UPI0006FD1537|nr:peptide methionine sulfoxide reductase [Caulobacter sp. Root487D2Y]KQY95525.1 peptide methionine sulfoxide reductase [Caulobacter sp. Root1455]